MTRDVNDSLQDILEAIGAIERFMSGVDFNNFIQNEEKIFAVEKALEIVGEAVKNVPEVVKDQYPSIPWRNIAGMRDKLAHHYWRTDVKVVWKSVREDIPRLKEMITQVLEDLDN